ncbi:hypothetical protein DFH07DRAFT_858868, partial [Mycena maculata]
MENFRPLQGPATPGFSVNDYRGCMQSALACRACSWSSSCGKGTSAAEVEQWHAHLGTAVARALWAVPLAAIPGRLWARDEFGCRYGRERAHAEARARLYGQRGRDDVSARYRLHGAALVHFELPTDTHLFHVRIARLLTPAVDDRKGKVRGSPRTPGAGPPPACGCTGAGAEPAPASASGCSLGRPRIKAARFRRRRRRGPTRTRTLRRTRIWTQSRMRRRRASRGRSTCTRTRRTRRYSGRCSVQECARLSLAYPSCLPFSPFAQGPPHGILRKGTDAFPW